MEILENECAMCNCSQSCQRWLEIFNTRYFGFILFVVIDIFDSSNIRSPTTKKQSSVFASSYSSKKWVVKVQTCRNQDNPNRIFSFYCVRNTANYTWVLQEVLKLSRKVLKLTPEPFQCMLSNLDLKTNTQFTGYKQLQILGYDDCDFQGTINSGTKIWAVLYLCNTS